MLHKIKIKDRDFYIQSYIPNEYANLSAIPVKKFDEQLECIQVDFKTRKLKHAGKETKYVKEFMSDLSVWNIINTVKWLMEDLTDEDDCPHSQGTYHDKEDKMHDDVIRCNLCDAVMNYSKKEYEGDLRDSVFWEEDW